MRRFSVLVVALMSIMFATFAWADIAIPALKGRVNDYANALTPAQEEILTASIKAIEGGSPDKPQVVILITPDMGGYEIEPYANEVFRAWGIGQKHVNNGILVVQSLKERKLRIEVGYGLEGAVTDAQSSVITEAMKVILRKDARDSFSAMQTAIERLAPLITEEGRARPAIKQQNGDQASTFLLEIIVTLFCVGMVLMILVAIFGRRKQQTSASHSSTSGGFSNYAPYSPPQRPHSTRPMARDDMFPHTTRAPAQTNETPREERDESPSAPQAESEQAFEGGGGTSGGGGASADY